MSSVAPRFLFIDMAGSARLRDGKELDVALAEGEIETEYTVDSTADGNLFCTFDLTNMDSGEMYILRKRAETIVNDVWANFEGRKRPNHRGCRWLD